MIVEDFGRPDAKIMLIGEAPGAEEERTGLPFVGASGKLLKQLLLTSGIHYGDCFVTNVVNVRPAGNNFGYLYEDAGRKVPSQRLEQSWFKLRTKIEAMKPNVVVCLGAEALRAVTGKRGIENWRGSVLSYKDTKVIATYHPAAVMRAYELHPIVELDFAKANKESQYRELKYQKPNIIIQPSVSTVLSFFDEFKSSNIKRISFDIETVRDSVRCIGLSYKDKTIVIPFITFGGQKLTAGTTMINVSDSPSASSYWNKVDEAVVIEKLREVFEDKTVQKVGQNSICFDQPRIEKEFAITINNHYLDTMHAWHCLYPELPKGLDFLASVLTDHPNYWTNKSTEIDEEEWIYCGMDALVTLEISYKIELELLSAKLYDFYVNHINRLAFALAKAQEVGILVDVKRRNELAEKFTKRAEETLADVQKSVGKDINLNSPKQINELLYDTMKFPKIFNQKGTATVDEDALKKLIKRYPDEKILAKIIQYRKDTKLVSTFLTPKLNSEDKMITSWNCSGTETGRISSSRTLNDEGMNLQNIPAGRSPGVENIREIFVAGNGRLLVKGDLSQAETRVVAELIYRDCGDDTLIKKYKEKNFDIHKWMASAIYKVPESQVTAYQRAVGKLANHSGNYGAGPRVLQAAATQYDIDGIDYNTAIEILRVRHLAIPGLKIWWSKVEDKLRRTRTITTCLGRRRIFFGRLEEQTYRKAYAYEPQSIVGDVCSQMFFKLSEQLENDCYPLLQVHDEVVINCPEDYADYGARMVMASSIIPLYITNDEPLVIPIEVSIGRNWKDCAKYKEIQNNEQQKK